MNVLMIHQGQTKKFYRLGDLRFNREATDYMLESQRYISRVSERVAEHLEDWTSSSLVSPVHERPSVTVILDTPAPHWRPQRFYRDIRRTELPLADALRAFSFHLSPKLTQETVSVVIRRHGFSAGEFFVCLAWTTWWSILHLHGERT